MLEARTHVLRYLLRKFPRGCTARDLSGAEKLQRSCGSGKERWVHRMSTRRLQHLVEGFRNWETLLAVIVILIASSVSARAQAKPDVLVFTNGDQLTGELISAAADLTSSVKLLGMKKNVGYYLQQSDIFVLSSVSEGLPVSQLEAMAVGLPMIVTDVGGMPDVINKSGAGMIAPKSNPNALAEAILKLAGDPDALKSMGAKARAAYERDYTIERMCGDYERLYRECLPSPAAAGHR